MDAKEQKIIAQCQQGNSEQFGLLYDQYIKAIYNFIYYKTMHQETAEDLTSHTFIKALDKIKTFQPNKGSFQAWLYRIARNTVIDHYRTQKPHTNIEAVWDLGDQQSLVDQVDNKITLDKVNQYLTHLTAKQREIIIMRLWDNLSYQEISAITNETETNCRMIVSRSLKKIQQNVLITLSIIIISSIIWTRL